MHRYTNPKNRSKFPVFLLTNSPRNPPAVTPGRGTGCGPLLTCSAVSGGLGVLLELQVAGGAVLEVNGRLAAAVRLQLQRPRVADGGVGVPALLEVVVPSLLLLPRLPLHLYANDTHHNIYKKYNVIMISCNYDGLADLL